MLLTLATRSFRNVITGDGNDRLSMLDLPEFTMRQLQLRGLNVDTALLAGWSFDDLDLLRDRADKAACPCLVLLEHQPLAIGYDEPAKREAARQRLETLSLAANRLGCSSVSIRIDVEDTDERMDAAAEQIKRMMPPLERLELNLLIAPGPGLTVTPDRLIELIKRIGGFRIGSLPSFVHAAETGDLEQSLRKLAPYAGAIHASVERFSKSGKHPGFDLAECVEAIRSVGFLNTLAIEYIGEGDPVEHIERARDILQTVIETESA